MGLTNKIGIVSSLPIIPGDDITLIFIISDNSKNYNKSYVPAFLPLFGIYDGVSITNVKKTRVVSFIENFFECSIEVILNDNHTIYGDKKIINKNIEIYRSLSYCIELTSVYKKMSSFKITVSGSPFLNSFDEKECLADLYIKQNKLQKDKSPYSFVNLIGKNYIDGTLYNNSNRIPTDLLLNVGEKEISDFLRFYRLLERRIGLKLKENDDIDIIDFRINYEMNKTYKDIIKSKLNKENTYQDIIKSDDREEKLNDIL